MAFDPRGHDGASYDNLLIQEIVFIWGTYFSILPPGYCVNGFFKENVWSQGTSNHVIELPG